jgi:thioredoxin reductase/NAD-dependent dihydropyrimidine dehydrogenase PreA subunit
MFPLEYLIYAVPAAAICTYYWMQRRATDKRNSHVKEQSVQAGLTEPASLHPIVDLKTCIGCGSCVKACPEQPEHHVLGLIQGKAHLVSPTDCIGHGACKTACPVNAITLVFGTEKRGVDIPVLSPAFETTVPGVFVAGELGGMGLIRNALEQGRQAVEVIARTRPKKKGLLDLLIVGAGPAGFAASLAALQHKLNFVTVEQDSLGGCVFQYPRAKLVMTSPAELPLVGKMHFKHTSKEDLLKFWVEAERKTGLKVNYKERVETVQRLPDGTFAVKTSKKTYQACTVLLAIGRRGTPRKLGVPGEELPKVVYRLLDPEQYRGQSVLIVGGGDSALEAAASIAELPETKVALSYRGEAFDRAKAKNRERVANASKSGRIHVLMGSKIQKIDDQTVVVDLRGKELQISNDAVIVSAGGILPTEFLKSVGIEVATKYGTR